MSMSNEGLLQDNFGEWAKLSGVKFKMPLSDIPFEATIDLNILKSAIYGIITSAERRGAEKMLEVCEESDGYIGDGRAYLDTMPKK